MDKTFDVEGIAKIMIIYRGGLLEAKKQFKVVMTEKELNDFRDYIDIIKCEEIGVAMQETSKSKPIVEPIIEEKEQEEPKGENEDEVRVRQQRNSVNKGTNKRKVQSK